MPEGHSAAFTLSAPATQAPRGQVSLIVARLVGVRALWEACPEAAGQAIRSAGELFARLAIEHRGYEVSAESGHMTLAFSSPLDAMRWALAMQRALLEVEWPPELLDHDGAAEVLGGGGHALFRGLRYAVALHLGEPDVAIDARTRKTRYLGPVVRLVEHVATRAIGGQILATPEAWEAVEALGGHLIEVDARALGAVRMPGREATVPVVQIVPIELAERTFEPLAPPTARSTNLPDQPGIFVGRQRTLQAIGRYYDAGRRLVTLKGPGGMGKTRLALRYGGLQLETFAEHGGVWFCDLSGASSIDALVYTVARALGITVRARSLQGTQQLAAALASRGRCLLILDNFEQLTHYAELTVGLWLRKAPRLRVMVTSRHRLGVEGEALVELTPLDTDDATALFCDRARRVCPDFELAESDRERLWAILERLHHVPLAVELAAAWVGVLTLAGIAARLKGGLARLDGVETQVELHPRHRSLADVMHGSWELLRPYEKATLQACSVFRGGFTVNAAQAVVDLSAFRRAPDLALILRSLRDKSLLTTIEPAAGATEVRWDLFATVQEFSAAHLAEVGLRMTCEARHAAYYLKLADDHGPQVDGALDVLEYEVDNLLAVHERGGRERPDMTRRAGLALDRVLRARGPFSMHLEILERSVDAIRGIRPELQLPLRLACAEALLARGESARAELVLSETEAMLGGTASPVSYAWLEAVTAWVLARHGRPRDGVERLRAAVTLLHSAAHEHTILGMTRIGTLEVELGEPDGARETLSAALELAAAAHRSVEQAEILAQLGNLDRRQGMPRRARERYLRAAELCQQVGDLPLEGRLAGLLGGLALDMRRIDEATSAFQVALERARATGDVVEAALALGNQARLSHHAGKGEEAEQRYEECIEALDAAGAVRWRGVYQGAFAALHHEQGRLEHAETRYLRALSDLERCGDQRFIGLVLARHGALLADRGDRSGAERCFARAQQNLEAVGDPHGLVALEVHRGHLDLARSRAGHRESAALARQRFQAATRPKGDVAAAPVAQSNDVRIALRLLRRSMELGRLGATA